MKKHKVLKASAGILCFALILCVLFNVYNFIITPKNMYGTYFPTSQTFMDFYHLDKNSADVIFLGSSHATCGFNPAELYDKYGITSYNLSSEEQNLIISYYWLEEALKTQNPRVVVLDCFMLYLFDNENLLVSRAGCTRKALDFMKWSKTKYEAIKAVEDLGEVLEFKTFIFPSYVYHDNWNIQQSDDYSAMYKKRESMLKGYFPLTYYNDLAFNPIETGLLDECEEEEPNDRMLEYLDRIVSLCRERDIKLVLTATPSLLENEKQAAFMNRYAAQNGIEIYDFNTSAVYIESGYDFAVDNHDEDHANLSGANKMTDYIGNILVLKYNLKPSDLNADKWEKYENEYSEYLSSTFVTHF